MTDWTDRYDPELALQSYQLALALFRRKLGEGDRRTVAPTAPTGPKP